MIDLGALPGGDYSEAYNVNDKGQVVGSSLTTGPGCDWRGSGTTSQHAFLWEQGTMTPLRPLGGPFSFAYGIDDRGQVAGLSTTASDEFHAVTWTPGGAHHRPRYAPRRLFRAGQCDQRPWTGRRVGLRRDREHACVRVGQRRHVRTRSPQRFVRHGSRHQQAWRDRRNWRRQRHPSTGGVVPRRGDGTAAPAWRLFPAKRLEFNDRGIVVGRIVQSPRRDRRAGNVGRRRGSSNCRHCRCRRTTRTGPRPTA